MKGLKVFHVTITTVNEQRAREIVSMIHPYAYDVKIIDLGHHECLHCGAVKVHGAGMAEHLKKHPGASVQEIRKLEADAHWRIDQAMLEGG